jgi:protoheme ferro-lyase
MKEPPMTPQQTKKIFSLVAEALEITLEEVVYGFKSNDQEIIKWVKRALRIHS